MITREFTCKILDYIDQEMVDTRSLAEQLLMWLSEDDVKQFYYANGFGDFDEDRYEMEEEDEN